MPISVRGCYSVAELSVGIDLSTNDVVSMCRFCSARHRASKNHSDVRRVAAVPLLSFGRLARV